MPRDSRLVEAAAPPFLPLFTPTEVSIDQSHRSKRFPRDVKYVESPLGEMDLEVAALFLLNVERSAVSSCEILQFLAHHHQISLLESNASFKPFRLTERGIPYELERAPVSRTPISIPPPGVRQPQHSNSMPLFPSYACIL